MFRNYNFKITTISHPEANELLSLPRGMRQQNIILTFFHNDLYIVHFKNYEHYLCLLNVLLCTNKFCWYSWGFILWILSATGVIMLCEDVSNNHTSPYLWILLDFFLDTEMFLCHLDIYSTIAERYRSLLTTDHSNGKFVHSDADFSEVCHWGSSSQCISIGTSRNL